jgi:hypothetical protein
MILYTIMPIEQVYPTQEQDFSQQKMITYKGIPMIVSETEDRSYQVVRIMSSDPQHYLDADCLPGTKISF